MRSRTNSSVRLEQIARLVTRTILNKQDVVTGLFRSNYPGLEEHAWVRDNVYAAHAVWGLARAYRNQSDAAEDAGTAYELEQSVVKVMRSLLEAMMRQTGKVEQFKLSQAKGDCLHAKYHCRSLQSVHGDFDWGHLQIDATSLFLLTLAQLTASGLQIVWNLDEVAFVQNLVFYIEEAYRIPDYGVWERGDKRNQGATELNASSIGMAKAALCAMNDLDLFGAHGSAASAIHVPADAIVQCNVVLESLLPRESVSKETDAALLSIIGYPAFAVEDPDLIQETRKEILDKLSGRYGCCRFLRDGYKTPREDQSRLYYEPWELAGFEGIECEWPLFTAYLHLLANFRGDTTTAKELRIELDDVLLRTADGLDLMPELYAVPSDSVDAEIANPGSQDRIAAGHTPFVWAQSLYILGRLIDERFIKAAELDPLNRRLSTERRPDTVVQVAIIAEDDEVKSVLAAGAGLGASVQTPAELSARFSIQPPAALARIWTQLGKNAKLGLSGRPIRDVGLLSTSKIYSLRNRHILFTPQFLDATRFYLIHDLKIMTDMIKLETAYLASAWNLLGRPLLVLRIDRQLLFPSDDKAEVDRVRRVVLGTLRRIRSGYIGETRVQVGRLEELVPTSCVTSLDFLLDIPDSADEDPTFGPFLTSLLQQPDADRKTTTLLPGSPTRTPLRRLDTVPDRKISSTAVRNASARHRSIILDPNDADMVRLRLAKLNRTGSFGESTVVEEGEDDASSLTSSTFTPGLPSPNSRQLSSETGLSGRASRGSRGSGGGEADGDVTPRQHSPVSAFSFGDGVDGLTLSTSKGSRMDADALEEVSVEELVEMLSETESVEEQGDLLYFIWRAKGADWEVEVGSRRVRVRELLGEVYARACRERVWWLVRLGAGLLEREVDDLARALGDLLVRQKQVTVGLPGAGETIIDAPLGPLQLQTTIRSACAGDVNAAMLTQEILVYLGMFVRTEPGLFQEMLRLRLGLILSVMTSELARTALPGLPKDDPTAGLLNLSPFDLKTLLYNVLSGKEIEAILPEAHAEGELEQRKIETFNRFVNKSMHREASAEWSSEEEGVGEEEEEESGGFWLRRRRIDGALNRVPPEFYARVWTVLANCPGGVRVGGQHLGHVMTREMTREEIKFALGVEAALNRVAEAEWRQLLVEGLMVLALVAESGRSVELPEGAVEVDVVVRGANELFLDEQRAEGGDATECCAGDARGSCKGVAGICHHFYDSPPSGRFGTISYLARAALALSPSAGKQDIECFVS